MDPPEPVTTAYTLSLDSVEKMAAAAAEKKIKEKVRKGYTEVAVDAIEAGSLDLRRQRRCRR